MAKKGGGVTLNIDGLVSTDKRIQSLHGRSVRIGFQSGGPRYDGVTALDVAIYNVFGTRTAPPRDFMGQTMREHKPKIDEACRRVPQAVLDGASPDVVLGQLGLFYQALMRWQIPNGNYKGNADSTKKRKGSAKPLVDTGRVLVPNITYVVR